MAAKKESTIFANHAIPQPMSRLTAGDLAAYVDAVTLNHTYVSSRIIIKSTLRLTELTKLPPKTKRKRQARKPPLIMEIPKKRKRLNQRRKCPKMIHQGNMIPKKKHNTKLDQPESATELHVTRI